MSRLFRKSDFKIRRLTGAIYAFNVVGQAKNYDFNLGKVWNRLGTCIFCHQKLEIPISKYFQYFKVQRWKLQISFLGFSNMHCSYTRTYLYFSPQITQFWLVTMSVKITALKFNNFGAFWIEVQEFRMLYVGFYDF